MESPNFMEMIYLQYSFNQYTFWDILWEKNNQNLAIMFIVVMETGHEYGSFCIFDVKNRVKLSKYTW